jgi:pimeloyl-ACP methyl ester carboxylesterase
MRLNRKTLSLASLAVFALVLLGALTYDPLDYEYQPQGQPAATFEEFYAARLAESKAADARPDNEERLVRYAPGKTPLAILYIHGYGASRAEGEMVIDTVAREFQANTYYMRLPGHGTSKEDHAAQKYSDYLNAVEETFAMMPLLGEKVIVTGTSAGGLLATYLAAKYPERVAALVLASPFYEFRDPTAAILTLPGGPLLVRAAIGEFRDASWKEDPDGRRVDGYEDHWLTLQYSSALTELARLRKFVAQPHVFGNVVSPSIVLYYYASEDKQDGSVNVAAILENFAQFGHLRGGAHPLNRAVAIADGNHILLSEYVRTDKQRIISELSRFLKDVQQPQ